MTCFQPCSLDTSFKARLRRAEQWYANQLSDKEPNTFDDYQDFGELLFTDTEYKSGLYYYGYAITEDGVFIYPEILDTRDKLVKWLVDVDQYAAKNLKHKKFKRFAYGDHLSPDGARGRIIEAVFEK